MSESTFGQLPHGHVRLTRAVSCVARRIYGENWTDIERLRREAAKLRSKGRKAAIAGKTKEARALARKFADAEARAKKMWPEGEPYYRRAQATVVGWLAKCELTAFDGVVPIAASFWLGKEATYVIEHGCKPMEPVAKGIGQKYEPLKPTSMITVDEKELSALLKELAPIAEGAGEQKPVAPKEPKEEFAKKLETHQRDEDIYKLFTVTNAANPRATRGRIFGLMREEQPSLFTNRREGKRGKGITDQTIERIIRGHLQLLRRFAAP